MTRLLYALQALLLASSVHAADDPVYFYQGTPISPHVFKEFVRWLSDTNDSPTVSIDLGNSANATNEYFGEVEQLDDHKYCSDNSPSYINPESSTGWTCYQWDGGFGEGMHLFTVFSNGGGTLSIVRQLLIKFHKDEGMDLESRKTYDRDLMTLMGTYAAYGGKARLSADRN